MPPEYSEHQIMNKSLAIVMMKQGKKLTHTHFSRSEWVSCHPSKPNKYIFEDDCECLESEFWSGRDEPSWCNGWRIFDESTSGGNDAK